MRAVRVLRYETAAVERGRGADALCDRGSRAHRDRAAHAVARRADLAALVDLRLLIEPGDERFRVADVRRRVELLREREHDAAGLLVERRARWHDGRALRTI